MYEMPNQYSHHPALPIGNINLTTGGMIWQNLASGILNRNVIQIFYLHKLLYIAVPMTIDTEPNLKITLKIEIVEFIFQISHLNTEGNSHLGS